MTLLWKLQKNDIDTWSTILTVAVLMWGAGQGARGCFFPY